MEYTPRYKTRNEDERYLATVAWLSCGNPKKKNKKQNHHNMKTRKITKPPDKRSPQGIRTYTVISS